MADENENLVKISDLPLGHRTDLEGSFVPVALPNQQTYKVPLEEFMDPLEIMVAVYGTTSMEAVTVALSAGKTIFAARQVSSVTRLAPLTDHATGACHFVWQNSDGTRELWELTSNGWSEESLDKTVEHILDLSVLDEENSTFDVVLTANRNNAISFVESSEQAATVAIEIEDAKSYNIQIVGACTLAITGVEWWSDVVTDITNKAEINIMNGRAIGVLIDDV